MASSDNTKCPQCSGPTRVNARKPSGVKYRCADCGKYFTVSDDLRANERTPGLTEELRREAMG